MKLPADNLSYPVRIIIGSSSGSGFFIRNGEEIYLVTAKHVLFSQDSVTKNFTLFDKKLYVICYPLTTTGVTQTERVYEFNLESLLSAGDLKTHSSADIVVIKLGSVSGINGGRYSLSMLDAVTISKPSDGTLISYNMINARRFGEVEVTNDVFVLGYPSSLSSAGMNQLDSNSALVRKGIVAGKNNINRSLILDCPVYGGNSGGIVIEVNQNNETLEINFHLIGIVVQFVPFVDQWRNINFPDLFNSSLQNSGYSVVLPVDYIYELIEEIETV